MYTYIYIYRERDNYIYIYIYIHTRVPSSAQGLEGAGARSWCKDISSPIYRRDEEWDIYGYYIILYYIILYYIILYYIMGIVYMGIILDYITLWYSIILDHHRSTAEMRSGNDNDTTHYVCMYTYI